MPPSFGGVLIKRKQLQRQRQSIDLVDDARKQARRLVKAAQVEADNIRLRAYHAGYQEGIVASAAAVADYLGQQHRLAGELQQQINLHARQLLSNAVSHPEIMLELLDEWLKTLPAQNNTESLILLMPAAARGSHAQMKQKLQAAWLGNSTIEYHQDHRFVMKCGERLAEFDGEAFIQNAALRLTTIDTMPAACRQLGDTAQRRLFEIFTHYFAPLEPDNGEASS